MKILQTIVLLNLINLNCICQGVPEKSIPSDQVFLHISKTLYKPGDTIRFQAYVRDRNTGIFETKSISLFALLLNSSGEVIDSARFRIDNSSSSGWLAIPGNVPSGFCSVVSYTSQMMNYDPGYVFTSTLEIAGDPSGTLPFKTVAGKAQEVNRPEISLSFMPESGSFLYGIKQRVAFCAFSGKGEFVPIKGTIYNQNNSRITDFESGGEGPGLLEFLPNPGDTYFARLNGDRFSGRKWPLPVSSVEGAIIRLLENKKGILDFLVRGQGMKDTLSLLVSMNDYPVFRKQINPDSLYRIKLSTDELPVGTGYISLIGKNNKIVADRAVLINYQKKPGIEIVYSRDSSSGGNVQFSIWIKSENKDYESSIVSVAIIDSSSGMSPVVPAQDIEGCFLFDKHITEHIPFASRDKLSHMSEEFSDLMLMAFGSRDSIESGYNQIRNDTFTDYDALKIIAGKRKEINIITLESSESYTLEPSGAFATLSYSMLDPSARQFLILPDKSRSGAGNTVRVDFPGNKAFTDKARKMRPFMNKGKDTPSFMADYQIDSAIDIEAVTIQPRQILKPVIYNKYQVQFQNTQTMTYSKKDFKAAITFEDILFMTLPYQINARAKMVYLGARIGRMGGGVPALIVLDDNPLWSVQGSGRDAKWFSSYDQIATMPASNISSITVVNGPQAYNLYGEPALGGVIFVVTDGAATMDGYMQSQQEAAPVMNGYAKPVRIFRTELNTENETGGSALYWNRELYVQAGKPAIISIPNKLIKGPFYLVVNGASLPDIPISIIRKYR
jgi:hypothetical protein